MKTRMILILSMFMVAIPASWGQGVNLKNGNKHVSYKDIQVPGSGPALEIVKTYNSRSTYNGKFGFGFGTYWETRLDASSDGCVVVQEYGGGSSNRFCPKGNVDAAAASKRIVEAMRKKSQMSGKNASKLIERLKTNAELRHAYAKRFNVEAKIPAGTKLYSNTRGIQEVVKTKDGYKRMDNDGKVEIFDAKGNLASVIDKNKYKVDLVYKKGQLFSIKDSFAKQIFFEWYPNGKVKSLWSVGDKKAIYKYKGDDLVYSKDVNEYAYAFDYDKNHNLTKVIYNPDRKKGDKEVSMTIKYEPKTFFTSEVIDRYGKSTKYEYGSDPKKPDDHYWTLVTKKGFNGKDITNRYEYEIKTKPDGQRYTYKVLTVVNGIKTETLYSECCGLPLKIQRGKNVTNFEYNEDGLLTKKSSSRGEFVQIAYDKGLKKIKKVTNNDGWTEFSYDKKGNLVKAWNNKGDKVALFYDLKGKIKKMVDSDKQSKKARVLNFKYNSLGKPYEISLEKVGKINVAYDNYGEIKKVESKAGHKMALQVTKAFQKLVKIVKPAGVNLNM